MNGRQRYRCWQSGYQFVGGERQDDAEHWHEYVDRKQTYREIGEAHGVSAKTVQRRQMRYQSERPRKEPRGVIVLMDTTYWGRAYGVMHFKDAIKNENHLKYFVTSETVERYVQGIAELERMGNDILVIVCDGRRGQFSLIGICHADYSLAGFSPAQPASASSAAQRY